ncbi:hypothetical protein BGZ65_010328 [Modicella reniformis]|uniref:Uncharacterized protein n=1 Tax=Modicella reniformis TaxID=1440133 RepID=A0A9P6MDL1_9FUNG|nr:hypothetical protein BGZ65_010328 [Modicella reniformis]
MESRQMKYIKDMDWISRTLTPLQKIKIAMRIGMFTLLNDRNTLYAKTPFLSTNASLPPFIKVWEREMCTRYVHTLDIDKYDNIQVLPEYYNTSVDQENDPSMDPDYMIDGVDMRNVGRWKDIVDLFEDRNAKNWACWPLLESMELKATGSGQENLDKMKPMIRRLRPDIEIV